MNLRALTLRYMGWCPGVKSAARFIPNQNIPPSKVILVFFIITSIMIGSYMISIQALSAHNYPSRVIAVTRNSRPVIVINSGRLYALAEVETFFSTGDHLGGTPHRSKVFLIEFSAEGEIVSSKPIIDIDRNYLGTLDAIVTSTGEWYVVYRYYSVDIARTDHSDLILKHSVDGENWSEPIVIAENIGTYWEHMTKEQRLKVRLIKEAQIIEDGEGQIHLIFSDAEHRCYHRSKISTGWSEIKEIPFNTDQPYLFTDKDNKIGIIGPEESFTHAPEELDGIFYSHLLPDGSIEDPVFIKDQNNALRGYFARMMYNPKDDEYLLSYRLPSH